MRDRKTVDEVRGLLEANNVVSSSKGYELGVYECQKVGTKNVLDLQHLRGYDRVYASG